MLEQIVLQKQKEVEELRCGFDPDRAVPKTNPINPRQVIANDGRVRVIAELKKASPVKGVLRPEFELLALARAYVENQATVLSVITDKVFFQGSSTFIPEIRSQVDLPILRKDFVIDELQLYESLYLGADVVLLIAALHDYSQLLHLSERCCQLGMQPLVEVHDREELKKVLDLPVQMIGINNRNLKDFRVDIKTSLNLADNIPERFIKISESGIKSPDDMKLLQKCGFNAALIGEALVSSPDPGLKLRELVDYDRR